MDTQTSNDRLLSKTTLRSNLSRADLLSEAVSAGEGVLSADGAFCATTGAYTGRSPKDRFVVRDGETESTIDWGAVNQPMSPAHFATLKARVQDHIEGKTLHAQDLQVGADPASEIKVRVVCEQAWHAAFARTLLRRPSEAELESYSADWTIIQCPSLESIPAEDGTNSSTFIALSFSEKLILIGGTAYAGEIKKSAFALLNYTLPAQGVMPMHCSANAGGDGDTALFFGLSGTGKTTLSADKGRALIGDDEHGWNDSGIFNFEGGCYAKAIDLTAEREPEIYAASNREGAILENVVLDSQGRPDFTDTSLTENTRCAYPLHHIEGVKKDSMGSHPRHVIFLALDAFGVLPPLSRLTPDQAVEHFLLGYTSKVAGTERGLGKGPQATFSACYGAPFMPRNPEVYGNLLRTKLEQHGASVWLVNTGWVGGAYGVGNRISLTHTRALIRSVLADQLDPATFVQDSVFGLAIPTACSGVPEDLLNPQKNWSDSNAYLEAAQALKAQFDERLNAMRPADLAEEMPLASAA